MFSRRVCPSHRWPTRRVSINLKQKCDLKKNANHILLEGPTPLIVGPLGASKTFQVIDKHHDVLAKILKSQLAAVFIVENQYWADFWEYLL